MKFEKPEILFIQFENVDVICSSPVAGDSLNGEGFGTGNGFEEGN